MESKLNKDFRVLMFFFSFHLMLTLGSLGFTCYSLHRSSRLDSRLTTLEHNLMLTNLPYRLSSPVIVKPTSTQTHPSGSPRKETGRIRRAAERPSKCRKCKTVCENSNGQRRVSVFFFVLPMDPRSDIVNSFYL